MLRQLCGESASVDVSKVGNARKNLKEVLKDYSKDEIYNLDETGLFFKLQPSKSICKQSFTSGTKRSKERFTIVACCNSNETHKMPLMLIGKTKKTKMFPQFSSRKFCILYSQQKSMDDITNFQ